MATRAYSRLEMRAKLNNAGSFFAKEIITSKRIPLYLCPAFSVQPETISPTRSSGRARRFSACLRTTEQRRYFNSLHVHCQTSSQYALHNRAFPLSCPGCGALAHTVDPNEAGYYSPQRKSLKHFFGGSQKQKKDTEDKVFEVALQSADPELRQKLAAEDLELSPKGSSGDKSSQTPLCDRCHNLIHHHTGVPIDHPSIDSIADTIAETPHKHNHVYHVIDAADFPLSVISDIHEKLSAAPQRSQNRRSKAGKYYHGRKTELSFIITRSDLLAPKKEQVDNLMPYLVKVLRDTLGHSGQDIRLGNVRCVSSKRGWWTKKVKEEIWRRGGGGWLVGKVNVGKSNLLETVFPKGRMDDTKYPSLQCQPNRSLSKEVLPGGESSRESFDQHGNRISEVSALPLDSLGKEDSLLPPAQPETPFPVMPVISPLPGTTASPIRLPFGSGKGELVDLPGLFRDSLDPYVREEHQSDLVMRTRIKAEQYVIKPGKSLLLGGLIRITPITPDLIIMAYPFVPLTPHVTSNEKAIGIQTQERPSGITVIAKPGIGETITSAGKYQLRWDVTKHRSGPLTDRSSVGLKADQLPYKVLSTDILIEGCGWVELVAQVRKKRFEIRESSVPEGEPTTASGARKPEDPFPEVEIFSPGGKLIGCRQPMNAWLLSGKTSLPESQRKSRPRRSMKGAKKALKKAKRLSDAS